MNRWIIGALAILTLLIISNLCQERISKNRINRPMEEVAITFRPELIALVNPGLRLMLADFFWIQTLLDSDLEHVKNPETKSWIYYRFHLITDIDPDFLFAYRFAALYLSVIKNDITGANLIFEKGLKRFPYDGHLNFYGALHDLFENKNFASALKRGSLLPKAEQREFIWRIVAKQTQRSGTGMDLITKEIEALKDNFPPEIYERMKKRIQEK